MVQLPLLLRCCFIAAPLVLRSRRGVTAPGTSERSPMMNIPQSDLEIFAYAARLSLEEAEQLLCDGEEVGWPPDMLSCMGSLAPRMVEMARAEKYSLPNKLDEHHKPG
jgi:hypothetical protein